MDDATALQAAFEGLVPMSRENLQAFAYTAALAYEGYPMFEFAMPGKSHAANTKEMLRITFLTLVKAKGFGFATSEDAASHIILMPPGFSDTGTWTFVKAGGLKLLLKPGWSATWKMTGYEAFAGKLRKKHTGYNCWYLYNLSTRPEHQGQGLGAGLLNRLESFLDQTGNACYLETNVESNVRMYEKHGFRLVETAYLPNTEFPHYCMLRGEIKA